MYALAGEYLATAGWFFVDADEPDAADGYLNQALRAASMAREPLLQAQIWNHMAMRARHIHAYAEAYAVAKAGLRSTAARNNPKVRALFHARVAQGHAFRGEYGLTKRSLDSARQALNQAAETAPTPPWLAFVDEPEINALSTIAFRALGRYGEAETFAVHDLAALPPTYTRNRVHGWLHLAEARLGRREIEQAAVDATSALELTVQIHGGLHTGRIAGRLRSLHRRLTQWPTVPAARDWCDAYDVAAQT
jgi:tetratricopeptide (TPR) repeat protein